MKRFTTLLLFANCLVFSQQETPLFIGAGPYFQSQPYTGASMKVLPSPVIFYDNHLFYVRWTRVGVYFMGDTKDDFSWGASLTAQPQPFGYKASDAPNLHGMSDKESSFEAGIALDAAYKDYFFNSAIFQDIMNKSNSYTAKAEVGKHIQFSNWDLYPSLMGIYHTAKFNQYYYGVTPSEATLSRSAYSPTSGIDYSFEIYAKHNITQRFSTLLNFRADYLDKTEQNSPIVSDKYMFSGLASIMYKFQF
jgi:outer membrane protein